jgi:hypothetical protein
MLRCSCCCCCCCCGPVLYAALLLLLLLLRARAVCCVAAAAAAAAAAAGRPHAHTPHLHARPELERGRAQHLADRLGRSHRQADAAHACREGARLARTRPTLGRPLLPGAPSGAQLRRVVVARPQQHASSVYRLDDVADLVQRHQVGPPRLPDARLRGREVRGRGKGCPSQCLTRKQMAKITPQIQAIPWLE